MAKKLPKPYKEADGWAFRLRRGEVDVYESGFKSEAAARAALTQLAVELGGKDKPSLMGPFKTSVGVGLCDYARERLPYLKGSRQEANRINVYLRTLGLPVICLTTAPPAVAPVKHAMRDKDAPPTVYFAVGFVDEFEREVPGSLVKHRGALRAEAPKSDVLRAKIARTAMADVSRTQVQEFVNQLKAEGFGASSIHLEVAVLRQLFEHARKFWQWARPVVNPAKELKLPKLSKGRERVMSEDEWRQMSVPLARYDNPFVLPLVSLMLETAMRSCEPLLLLKWQHVDWDAGVLRLPDGKVGARDVPLSIDAMKIMRHLRAMNSKAEPSDPVFNTTYSAVSKAWRECRKEVGIIGLFLHDLRHTAGSRYSEEFNGNRDMLKVMTGHAADKSVTRYVNISAEMLARKMRGEDVPEALKPAGTVSSVWDVALEAMGVAAPFIEARHFKRSEAQRIRRAQQLVEKNIRSAKPVVTAGNVIAVNFRRLAA